MVERERKGGRERESFIRNNIHNGVVSGAARRQALHGPMWSGSRVLCWHCHSDLKFRVLDLSQWKFIPVNLDTETGKMSTIVGEKVGCVTKWRVRVSLGMCWCHN